MLYMMQFVLAFHRFARVGAIGFTLMLPLLGAVSVSPDITVLHCWKLIGPAIAFHLFAYVLNDVHDLHIDKSSPIRAGSPLVENKIQVHTAQWFGLIQLPLALLISQWTETGKSSAQFALLIAFATMYGYNAWGKTFSFPPLMDALQGSSWVSLVAWGALTVNTISNKLLIFLCGDVFTFILLVNGIHGALRDLKNDHSCGVKTTAIFLGAYCHGENELVIGRWLPKYAYFLQIVLIVFAVLALCNIWRQIHQFIKAVAACMFILLCATCIFQSRVLFDRKVRVCVLERRGLYHLICCNIVFTFPYLLLMRMSVLHLMGWIYVVPLIAIVVNRVFIKRQASDY